MPPSFARLRTCLVVLAATALWLVTNVAPVRGQACCAGGALLTPARLGPRETLGFGLQARVRSTRGTFGPDGRWSRIASGDTESAWEQSAVVSVRLLAALQASLVLPVVETHRRTSGWAETGGGLGDLSLTGRYDLTSAGDSPIWPGVGLLLGATAPTGRAADAATKPLSTDATGAGTWDVSLGLSLEQLWGRWFTALDGWATHHFARRIRIPGAASVHESFSNRLTVLALAGFLFPNDMAAAIYLNAFQEGEKRLDGRAETSSTVRLTTLGCTWVWPWALHWRGQLSGFADLPLEGAGRNQPSAYGGSLSVLWVAVPST